MKSRRAVILLLVLLWWLSAGGCGSGPVERTGGVISGSLAYSGEWPEAGYIILALFKVAPWDPQFVPGAPAAFRYLQQASSPIRFVFDSPPVAFGEYAALVAAWKDPDDPNARTCMHPVSVYGTDLERMENAQPIVLNAEQPDRKDLIMPAAVFYRSAEEMRRNYPSL